MSSFIDHCCFLTLEEKQLKMNRQTSKTLNYQLDSRFYFEIN